MLGIAAVAQLAVAQLPFYGPAWRRWLAQEYHRERLNRTIDRDVIAQMLREAQQMFPDERVDENEILRAYLPPSRKYQDTDEDLVAILMATLH